jgi:hypothetical protein
MKLLALLFITQITLRAAPALSTEAAVLQSYFASEEKEGVAIVLQEKSSIGIREPGRDWKGPLRKSAEKMGQSDMRETVEDFIAKNDTDSLFAGLVLPKFRIVVVPEADLRLIFSDSSSGWDGFRKKFGTSSLHYLSRVGFSKDGRTALFFADVQHDWTDGHGEFHVMRKKEDAWIEDSSVMIGWSHQS